MANTIALASLIANVIVNIAFLGMILRKLDRLLELANQLKGREGQ